MYITVISHQIFYLNIVNENCKIYWRISDMIGIRYTVLTCFSQTINEYYLEC